VREKKGSVLSPALLLGSELFVRLRTKPPTSLARQTWAVKAREVSGTGEKSQVVAGRSEVVLE
jgi:hypothetical protein